MKNIEPKVCIINEKKKKISVPKYGVNSQGYISKVRCYYRLSVLGWGFLDL